MVGEGSQGQFRGNHIPGASCLVDIIFPSVKIYGTDFHIRHIGYSDSPFPSRYQTGNCRLQAVVADHDDHA
jgi:hypothetical protein